MIIYSEKPMEMFFDGSNPMLRKEGSPLEFNLLDTLRIKIACLDYVLIDYTTPSQVDLKCPMTIPSGLVICRSKDFQEFVVWRYGVYISEEHYELKDLEVNLHHGDYCKDLISAVRRYEERQR